MQAMTSDKNHGANFLVFSVKKELFAISTVYVQEIMHSAKIHPLPFVPDYIEGVVNCRGIPYTVVNIKKMDGNQNCEIEGATVLVFKREDDQFAIHISNIEMFFEPEENDIRADGIRYKMNLIPFFDANLVEKRLLADLKVGEL